MLPFREHFHPLAALAFHIPFLFKATPTIQAPLNSTILPYFARPR